MKNEKRLPRVGDIVEMLRPNHNDMWRYRFIIENPYRRYYKFQCLKSGQRCGWNLGWSEEAEKNWEFEWKIR